MRLVKFALGHWQKFMMTGMSSISNLSSSSKMCIALLCNGYFIIFKQLWIYNQNIQRHSKGYCKTVIKTTFVAKIQ